MLIENIQHGQNEEIIQLSLLKFKEFTDIIKFNIHQSQRNKESSNNIRRDTNKKVNQQIADLEKSQNDLQIK